MCYRGDLLSQMLGGSLFVITIKGYYSRLYRISRVKKFTAGSMRDFWLPDPIFYKNEGKIPIFHTKFSLYRKIIF